MDTTQAIRQIINASGKSIRQAAGDMGKSPTYLSSFLTRGSIPKADTLATLANVCEYDLCLISRETGETIRIDPIPREQ